MLSRRLRGIVLNAIAWGCVWGAIAPIVQVGVGLLILRHVPLAAPPGMKINWVSVISSSVLSWAASGALVGAGFSALLIKDSSERPGEGHSVRRSAMLGGVAGAVVPLLAQALGVGHLPLPMALFLPVGGGLGAGLASLQMRMARHALPMPDESPLLREAL